MAGSLNINRIHSSSVLHLLLGDISKYESLMQSEARRINKKYPNPNLAKVFSILPKKLAIITPMVLCDDFTQDLGGKCENKILKAIGLNCLPISTHDDIVDEDPKDRKLRASLIYAGNIAALEGMKILVDNNYLEIIHVLLKSIKENHYRQQFRVDLLWDKKISTFEQYLEGIRDIYSFVALGPECSITITSKKSLRKKILRFAINYGFALQLIDDLREVEDDKISGYFSFPILEGKPYTKSFKFLDEFLIKARENLDPEWKRINKRLKNLELYTARLKGEFYEK